MGELGEYLQRAARTPWDWSTHDCCTFLADWCVLRGNDDPMGFVRGTYNSLPTAARCIASHGGLLELARRGMIEAGIPEADEPRTGDGGIIKRVTADGEGECCAIYSDGKWVSLGVHGVAAGPADVLGIWRP